MELKKKLSQLRKDKGMTQLELAEALDVSRQTVSRWEVGTVVPSLDNLVSLSELYQVPLDYLVREEAEKPEPGKPEPAGPAPGGGGRGARARYFAVLALSLTAGALIFGSQMRNAERNDTMDMVNSVQSSQSSAYQPVRPTAPRADKSSTFTGQAQNYYGISGSGGGVPIVSPLLRLSLDYNNWKETQPPQALPGSQGRTEENLAYLRERYAGSLTMFRKMEALDTMFDMGIITAEQRRAFYGEMETKTLSAGQAGFRGGELEDGVSTSFSDRMARQEQELYRLSPLAKSETLDDLFSWLDGQG